LRILGGVDFRGSFEFFDFDLFSALIFYFGLICLFSCLLLILRLFLVLDDLLELFVGFWSSNCASWDLRFEIQNLCFLLSMDSSKGRLRHQVISALISYVMSH
jgi:hypothetical protein